MLRKVQLKIIIEFIVNDKRIQDKDYLRACVCHIAVVPYWIKMVRCKQYREQQSVQCTKLNILLIIEFVLDGASTCCPK